MTMMAVMAAVKVAQAARDLDVHATVLRSWVREFAGDLRDAFPGNGQMKPGQLEIERDPVEIVLRVA